jgi:hypothetical protein
MEKTCSLDRGQLHQPMDGGAWELDRRDMTRCPGRVGFTLTISRHRDVFLRFAFGSWLDKGE